MQIKKVKVKMTSNPSYVGMETIQLKDPQHDFTKADSSLSFQEKKYCRCLLEVEAKGKAYSPYGVCTKSTGAQVHSCSDDYDWSTMSYEILAAYASLHKINIEGAKTREDLLRMIGNWKLARGEKFSL